MSMRHALAGFFVLGLWCSPSVFATNAPPPLSEPAASKNTWGDSTLSLQGYPEKISLERAVEMFNQQAQRHALGRTQPPLTANEVVAALRAWDVGEEPMKKKFFQMFQRIATTRAMPKGSYLGYSTGTREQRCYDIDTWEIYLRVGMDVSPRGQFSPIYYHTLRGKVFVASRPAAAPAVYLPPSHETDRSLDAPKAVVADFYTTLNKFRAPPYPTLDAEFKTLSAFLGKDLNRLLADALQADAAYTKKFPSDKPYFGDGTCFFYGGGDCNFTTFRLAGASRARQGVEVTVQLTLVVNPNEPTFQWNNVVTLKQEKDRWVIDDIAYFGVAVSGHLKEAAAEARKEVENP